VGRGEAAEKGGVGNVPGRGGALVCGVVAHVKWAVSSKEAWQKEGGRKKVTEKTNIISVRHGAERRASGAVRSRYLKMGVGKESWGDWRISRGTLFLQNRVKVEST